MHFLKCILVVCAHPFKKIPLHLQGDPSGQLQPPIDLVMTVLADGGPLLWLPTAQAGWQNIPNQNQQEVVTDQMGHP